MPARIHRPANVLFAFGLSIVAFAMAPALRPAQAESPATSPTVVNQRPQDTTCIIDKRGNILILKHLNKFQLPPKNSWNIPKVLDAEGIESYDVCDTTDFAGRVICRTFIPSININTVQGDGLIIESSGSTICHGVIANVTGAALVISGSNNSVSDIVIAHCGSVVKFLGRNNIVVCTIAASAQGGGSSSGVAGTPSTTSVEGKVINGGGDKRGPNE